MKNKVKRIKAKNIKVGVKVDLEPYIKEHGFDLDKYPSTIYEYEEVMSFELETPDCIRIDFQCESFGMKLDQILFLKAD